MGLFRIALIPIAAVTLSIMLLSMGNPDKGDMPVITSSEIVESELAKFKDVIGEDYAGYRNHVYRTLSYAMRFLGNDQKHRKAIEAALVYHDIALWTANELSYLEPSIKVAKRNLRSILSKKELKLAIECIKHHHKITAYEGPHAAVVNAVRKADWVDASQGLITKGITRDNIAKARERLPYEGFHVTLLGFVPRVRGWNIPLGLWELGHIFKF